MLRNLEHVDMALLAVAVAGLAGGLFPMWLGADTVSTVFWWIGTVPVLASLVVEIVRSLLRRDFGLDLIAALSMTSALVIGEPLAANVVALMYAGGNMLERFAEGRARAEMTGLLERVPRTAMRRSAGGLETVPIGSIVPGDTILVRQGEVVPVDGQLATGHTATLDTSSLTGESIPQPVDAEGEVLSGSTCVARPFEMVALRPAAESTYASIIRLVESAQSRKAPMSRLADRYAFGFFFVTIAFAALAWFLSGSPERAVAVLVVATPCPLILAVPVALISGLSRTARAGVLLKSGGVLEKMAGIRTLVIDKTGTLTHGRARVRRIEVAPGFSEDELLRLAASIDQASTHVLAEALADAASSRGLVLSLPSDTAEEPGAGIAGLVDGRRVVVGGRRYVIARAGAPAPVSTSATDHRGIVIAVAVDGHFAGEIFMEDPLRADARDTIADMRRLGIARVILASGDQQEITERIGALLALDEVYSQLNPAAKAELVAERHAAGPLMMVGDGVNDAPALAAADVGVAMGARGSVASTEAADAVILIDDLRPVAKGIEIAQRTRGIALQSVWAGLGLSLVAMAVAAYGYLPPVQGAMVQEAIDIAVIFNALRALR
jgi:heavy metal translocating P-type ATPase